uniref:Uncharacterized protein n=1 Tax=Plectus sambesii TaxID=2011161 RepID=A0A914X7S9_9BILA
MVLYDSKKLQQFTFSYFIVDEGQRIKNGNSRLHIALKSLNLQQRLLMTGTPLQNNLTELWALLNFLMPQIFNNCLWFLSFFDFSEVLDAGCEDDERKRIVMQKEKENQMVRKLHDILAAFMLRREKTNVGLSLPAKKEILVYCPVTVKQRQMYMEYLTGTVEIMRRGFKEKPEELIVTGKRNRKNRVDMAKVIAEDEAENWNFDEIDENASPERDENDGDEPQMILRYNKRSLLSTMVTLRKISMHPQLIEWHADKATGEYEINDDMIKLSGKMLVLDRMLKELKRRGHKVLLFSQMTQMLDILHDYCDYRDYKCARLDGSYSLKVREENIADFSENHDTFVFLLSTRAGGLGLNLVAADTVIFYDSDWNPQMDLQAQDRCHRIGQTRPVVVYRLASKGTIDESIIKRARQKRRLERIVIQSERFTLNSSEAERLSPEDLRQLLESVDHSSMFQAAEDGDVISDADLKQLLDRSDLKNVENIKKVKKEKTDAFVVLNVETE